MALVKGKVVQIRSIHLDVYSKWSSIKTNQCKCIVSKKVEVSLHIRSHCEVTKGNT